MPSLPKIDIEDGPIVKRNHNFALGLLISMITLIVLVYKSLPDLIPIHYNLLGAIDAMGGKTSLWILALIATILFLSLKIAGKYPHTHNYREKITEVNALVYYSKSMELISFTNVLTMALLFCLSLIICLSTKYTSFPFGTLFIIFTVLYLASIIGKTWQIKKATKNINS